jgi:preprotein translocase subunit SecG
MDNISNNEFNTGLGNIVEDTYSYINNILTNPTVIIILLVVLVVYIILFITLGGDTGSSEQQSSYFGSLFSSESSTTSSSSSNTIMYILAIIFILLVLINGVQYIFGLNIMASIKNLFTPSPEIDITIQEPSPTPVPEIKLIPQVFNIPGNTYTYPDAKALCKAYGSRLATYDEVENAYNRGGEWCNYGWSENQMALFPTQKKTWDKLQTIEGHEHDCGRPGVNGGYIANPKVQFGVNCYGYKPVMTPEEEELMATQPIYPVTMKDVLMEKRVNYWKDKLSEILVSPFNHYSWSKL